MDIYKRTIKSTPELAIKRFWDKVDKKGENDCWEWKGAKGKHGHGVMTICQKIVLTHRFSYELFYGKIPKGLYICHKCDNGSCINPQHLFAGTQKENMHDCVIKGRTAINTHPEIIIENGRKLGKSNIGKKHTPEWKIKMREIMKIKGFQKGHVPNYTGVRKYQTNCLNCEKEIKSSYPKKYCSYECYWNSKRKL